MVIRAAIIGASGYTGVELIRLLSTHPNVVITTLVAESNAGKDMGEVYQHLGLYSLPPVIKIDQVQWENVDVAFGCLPHATTQKIVLDIPDNIKVIDLSADFRLFDVDTYATWYGHPHLAPELQKEAVYGLSEFAREAITKARIIACPGCYPTSVSLPLLPLLHKDLIETSGIIIDAKSGISGAGRSAKVDNLFTEINEGTKAYAVCQHRHTPEIEQTLSEAAGKDIQVNFIPQVVPMNRGILSNIYVQMKPGVNCDTLREVLTARYKQEPFVHVLPENVFPSTRHVQGTNHNVISVTPGRTAGLAVLTSVIDNLVKGASGQAIQNMNIAFGLDETSGLHQLPLYP
jgi:N-acetyl-gamma-glutamyl-phosphate reductase